MHFPLPVGRPPGSDQGPCGEGVLCSQEIGYVVDTEQPEDDGTRFLISKDGQYKRVGEGVRHELHGLVILDVYVRRASTHCAAPRRPQPPVSSCLSQEPRRGAEGPAGRLTNT